MSEKKSRYIITELILVMADLKRTFTGSIRRGYSDGRPVVWGSVTVNEGMIYSLAKSEDDLVRNLDEMCLLKLDHQLHNATCITTEILDTEFFLN